jgi:hypothetical protein
MKDIYTFGTCRVCILQHPNIKFNYDTRQYHSKLYTIGDDIRIHTEPVNYTTKLQDALDSILYMQGKLFENKKPKEDDFFRDFFFKSHPGPGNTIDPKTHPLQNGEEIKYDKVIIEAFSIKQYLINTTKFGEEYYMKNLPWKLGTGYEKTIEFNPDDFIIREMTEDEVSIALDTIKNIIKCDILIVGPYVSRFVPEIVNQKRINVQNILRNYCNTHNGFSYFDLSSDILRTDTIESDSTHIHDEGKQILTNAIYNFIMNDL